MAEKQHEYSVTFPITGYASVTVKASSEEEAVELARSAELTLDEWDISARDRTRVEVQDFGEVDE